MPDSLKMTDSMEDRIHKSGKHERFSKAYDAYEGSRRCHKARDHFYDELIDCGATSEEADEFISMMDED